MAGSIPSAVALLVLGGFNLTGPRFSIRGCGLQHRGNRFRDVLSETES